MFYINYPVCRMRIGNEKWVKKPFEMSHWKRLRHRWEKNVKMNFR